MDYDTNSIEQQLRATRLQSQIEIATQIRRFDPVSAQKLMDKVLKEYGMDVSSEDPIYHQNVAPPKNENLFNSLKRLI